MGRLLEGYRRVNRTRRVEDSVGLRVAVLVAVEIAVLATLVSGAAPPLDAVAALVLLPVGAWVSQRRAGKDNTLIKLALTIGAALALMRFFGDIRYVASVDDTRGPLAALFLGVQVLHGFDLPARRDLGFTLASSLTLIALSATSTHSMVFAILLLVYAVAAGASMVLIQRSAALQRADELRDRERLGRLVPSDRPEPAPTNVAPADAPPLVQRLAGAGAGTLRAALPALLVGVLVFGLLPRSNTTQLGGLPFKGIPSLGLTSPFVTNPGLDGDGRLRGPGDGALGFNPTAYFGFSEYVDLRTVGQLSDEPVMRVRADRPRLWRGIVFDLYDGTGWTRTSEQPDPTYGTPVRLEPEPASLADRSRVVQTFELLADTPNLVFAAADPIRVYLSGGSVHHWEDGTITTGQLQSRETVYSVVSVIDTSPPDVLRAADGDAPPDLVDRYTQLPAGLPQRVRDLARTLTDDQPTPYLKAEVVQAWIGANTEYTLNEVPPAGDTDLVDHFLFESRRGWCEPIASSMTVLLRAAGVPARFATGFQPGSYNPLTGVFDVKMSNAHAWVEVHIPGHGWIPFDPTGAVPEAVDNSSVARLPLISAFKWIAGAVAALVPDPVRDAVAAAARAVVREPAALIAMTTGIAALVAGWWLWRRRRLQPPPPGSPFEELALLLGRHGIDRDAWQTPREYVRRVRLHRPDLPEEPVGVLLGSEETRRYAPHHARPSPDTEDRALREIEAALERTLQPTR
ncbi:MAG: DUF3488 domain-containing protein [Actinobacteria bacterium]|nr:DUF3488 domain-containing protein [Actinomycetota bacterium]